MLSSTEALRNQFSLTRYTHWNLKGNSNALLAQSKRGDDREDLELSPDLSLDRLNQALAELENGIYVLEVREKSKTPNPLIWRFRHTDGAAAAEAKQPNAIGGIYGHDSIGAMVAEKVDAIMVRTERDNLLKEVEKLKDIEKKYTDLLKKNETTIKEPSILERRLDSFIEKFEVPIMGFVASKMGIDLPGMEGISSETSVGSVSDEDKKQLERLFKNIELLKEYDHELDCINKLAYLAATDTNKLYEILEIIKQA